MTLSRGSSTLCLAVSAALLFALTATGRGATVGSYNTYFGTQTINPAYKFTDQSALLETAQGIRAMGSNMLKINLKAGKYAGLSGEPSRLDDLARWGDFKRVLDMDFARYFFWAYSENQVAWRYGEYTEAEQLVDYQEIYDLTTHLLTEYNGTNKTFYIGHWEGDWHFLNGAERLSSPDQQVADQMIEWYNVRQLAIDNAKAALSGAVADVNVFHYAEVNHVRKAIENPELRSVTNDVLPQSNVDFVSWSAWEMLNDPATGELADAVTAGLEHIQSQLAPKAGLPTEKRAFLGEMGWNIANEHVAGDEAAREQRAREVALGAIDWGTPFVQYWQLYDNSANKGDDKRFWLIDDQGDESPLYWTMYNYNLLSQQYLHDYEAEFGVLPSDATFREFALETLASVPSDGPIALAALIGDYDGSGQVEQGDLNLVLQNWGVDTAINGLPTAWVSDPPDGLIDQDELNRVLNNWGDSSAPALTAIPEPGGLLLAVTILTQLTLQRIRPAT
ncbi:MAG: hypothetical protein AAF916_01455 [Planctomycetota bacterium]